MATREVEGDMSALLVNDRIFFVLFFSYFFSPEIGFKSNVDGLKCH